jgi:hypothetical protein
MAELCSPPRCEKLGLAPPVKRLFFGEMNMDGIKIGYPDLHDLRA